MNIESAAARATLGQYRQFVPPLPHVAEGPFEGIRMGAVDVPLHIRDLSVEGCLIELQDAVVTGRRITIQIKLPVEGWIALKADTLRVRDSSWLAAKFVNIDAAARERLARGITRAVRTPP
jgi:hypothetical protein